MIVNYNYNSCTIKGINSPFPWGSHTVQGKETQEGMYDDDTFDDILAEYAEYYETL